MKAKTQRRVGVITALVIIASAVFPLPLPPLLFTRYPYLVAYGLAQFTIVVLLTAYVLALMAKNPKATQIIVWIWCAAWLIPTAIVLVAYMLLGRAAPLYVGLVALWPVNDFGLAAHRQTTFLLGFSSICYVLFTVLLWIGARGLARIMKPENQSHEEKSPESEKGQA